MGWRVNWCCCGPAIRHKVRGSGLSSSSPSHTVTSTPTGIRGAEGGGPGSGDCARRRGGERRMYAAPLHWTCFGALELGEVPWRVGTGVGGFGPVARRRAPGRPPLTTRTATPRTVRIRLGARGAARQ